MATLHDRTRLAAAVAVAATTLVWLTVTAATPASTSDASRVKVEFVEPETFSDVRDRAAASSDTVRDSYLRELRAEIVSKAMPRLGSGERLVVNVRDIDMAGDFAPRASMGIDAPRIVRNVSVPRIDLDFQLVSANGSVLKSGARSLKNAKYLSRVQPATRDPLRHEKALLDEWLAEELKR